MTESQYIKVQNTTTLRIVGLALQGLVGDKIVSDEELDDLRKKVAQILYKYSDVG